MSDKCCMTDETANKDSSHPLQGRTQLVGAVPVYISGQIGGSRAIVVAPDIFGIIPVSMRFIDDLSRGKP